MYGCMDVGHSPWARVWATAQAVRRLCLCALLLPVVNCIGQTFFESVVVKLWNFLGGGGVTYCNIPRIRNE